MHPSHAYCIYCAAIRPASEFNQEHVLPRAFGDFDTNALTLDNPRYFRVCAACNQQLGDTLDIGLARGSMEAVLRLQRGLASPGTLRGFQYERLVISLATGHPLAPMLLRFVPLPSGGGLSCAPTPQLRLSIGNGPLLCIREGRIEEELPLILAKGPVSEIGVFWWAGDPDAPNRVQHKAVAAGLTNRSWTEIIDDSQRAMQKVDVEFSFTIDAVIARAIAKIALEYFVWSVETTAAHLIKPQNIDTIRRFVVAGDGDWRSIVRPTNAPILANETETLRRTRDHLVALRWSAGSPVVVQVALFNDITYNVLVCGAPSLVWQRINSGHRFRYDQHTAERLLDGSGLIQPPYGPPMSSLHPSRGSLLKRRS